MERFLIPPTGTPAAVIAIKEINMNSQVLRAVKNIQQKEGGPNCNFRYIILISDPWKSLFLSLVSFYN